MKELIKFAQGVVDRRYENGYGFIYVNLDRKDCQANDDISRSVQVQLTNNSRQTMDYFFI